MEVAFDRGPSNHHVARRSGDVLFMGGGPVRPATDRIIARYWSPSTGGHNTAALSSTGEFD